jgi:hypothetical protein
MTCFDQCSCCLAWEPLFPGKPLLVLERQIGLVLELWQVGKSSLLTHLGLASLGRSSGEKLFVMLLSKCQQARWAICLGPRCGFG